MNETPKQAARRLSAKVQTKGYKPQALHEYTDDDGKPLYWRIRLKHEDGDKWIRPMRNTGDGFDLGEPSFTNGKPLYRLHELAARPDDPVVIVEGEWCADKLAKRGILATTSGAADSADKADWRPLAGRKALIWPDYDDAGQRYAQSVAERLLALSCMVSIVDAAALSLPKKGDAADWLQQYPDASTADVMALKTIKGNQIMAARMEARPSTPYSNQPADAWPEPQTLTLQLEAEPYPLEALPGTIRQAVEEVAGFVQAPIPLIACSALTAISLAVQAHVDVQRAEKLTGPASLFFLTIADSGERKSTCDGFFTAAIREYQQEQSEAAKPLLKAHEADKEAWEAKRSGIKDKLRQLAKDSKPTGQLEKELRDLARERPEPPRVPRLLYTDATPEALGYGLAKHWPSAGVVSAEGGIVLGSHGMNKDSVMRNLTQLNMLWDGDTLHIDRRTQESFAVKGARLTIGLQVQGATLQEAIERTGQLMRGTGFFARFLMAWPESTMGNRPLVEAPANWPALTRFNRRMAVILNQAAPIDDDGTLNPMLVSFTPSAKALWGCFYNVIESGLHRHGELYDVRDVASKAADNVARLAGVFQVFEHGPGPISEESVQAATQIVAWHLNESRRFFGEMALPPDLAHAVKLDNWLVSYCQRNRTEAIPTREVMQIGPNPLRNKAALEAALAVLIEHGRARLATDGRRKEVRLNPALLGIATATPAIPATDNRENGASVATVAGIAVASLEMEVPL